MTTPLSAPAPAPDPRSLADELKRILETSGDPHLLDGHPWAVGLLVQQGLAADPALARRSEGERLLAALVSLFRDMQPAAPPRRGKRLDTAWSQFGLLAAMYFAPAAYGAPRPTSLRDAWGRIDPAIAFFVFGRAQAEVPPGLLAPYRLTAAELEPAPASTLSDWHVHGLERLAGLLRRRERHLSQQLGQPSPILDEPQASGAVQPSPSRRGPRLSHRLRIALAGLLALALLGAGWKAWRLFSLARALRAELAQVQALAADEPDMEAIASAGPLLSAARRDVAALRRETGPFLWMGRGLAWLPVYGPDLAAAGPLLDLAGGLTVAADEAYQAGWPILQAALSAASLPELLERLTQAMPRFEAAHQAAVAAAAARGRIPAERLSPRVRELLVGKIDPYLPLLQNGLAVVNILPRLAGAAGPQTYLLLLQNEDELRASGGFLTAVGTVTVEGGRVVDFNVEDSYAVDDLSKPFPPAPWQLDQYMAAHIMLLRDSNWSPDFPTVALWTRYLYTYSRGGALHGAVALDQAAIRLLLEGIGPVQIEGIPEPVTAGNVIALVREAKDPFLCGGLDMEKRARCKVFLKPLAQAILSRVLDDPGASAFGLARTMLQGLEQRHILLQMDEPAAAAVLAERGWDGALRPGPADFLMVVDSNLGFNKVNAAVTAALSYQVDLSDPAAPTATLSVTHTNPPAPPPPEGTPLCKPGPDYGAGDYAELIARCYWDYLRVYVPAGAQLIGADLQPVPGEWMLLGQPVPARVDELGKDIYAEKVGGIREYGALLVVPPGQARQTGFRFELSPTALTRASGGALTYSLRVQKQPGAGATPLHLEVRLPPGARVTGATLRGQPAGQVQGERFLLDLTLATDAEVSIVFYRE